MIEAGWNWFPEWWRHNYQSLQEQLADPSFDGGLIVRYAVQALLVSLPAFVADYLIGLGVLKRLGARLEGGLRHAAALGIGTAVAALGIFLLGTFGRVTQRGVIALTVVQGVVGLVLAWSEVKSLRPRLRWLWALPLVVMLVPDWMMPLVEYDSTMYHMASARWYMSQHKMTYHEGIRFNAQPHMPVMLYLRQWWITNDGNLVKLVNLEYVLMLLGLFGWMARRYRVKWGTMVALGLALGAPIFGYITRQEYADLALTAWLSVGVAVMVAHGGRYHVARLVAAGLLLGACGASKLQGLVVVGCFLVADAVATLVRGRDVMAVVRRGLVVGLPVVAVGLPWWVRGWRYTGSPFYPFLSDSPDVKALFQVNANYGVGRDVMAFLALPWNMITVGPEKFADLFKFGPSCLIVLVVGVLAVVVNRRRVDVGTWVVMGGSLLFTVFWFRSGQVMRYEACLLPLWGMLLVGALARLGVPGRVGAVMMLPLFAWGMLLVANPVRYGMFPPVTWPATQALLNNMLPYYKATVVAGKVIGKDEKVYTWFCDDIRAYAPGRSYGDWFGGYTYTWLGNVHTGPKVTRMVDMLARLKQNGFRYVIVDRKRARQGGTIYTGDFLTTGMVEPGVAVPGTETVFDDGRYAVFRLI